MIGSPRRRGAMKIRRFIGRCRMHGRGPPADFPPGEIPRIRRQRCVNYLNDFLRNHRLKHRIRPAVAEVFSTETGVRCRNCV